MMKTIDICISPELLHLYNLEDKIVVVVDIFRATTSMVTAMAYGVERIIPVAQIEDCQALGKQGYLTAAERGGEQVRGFDFGNSPYSFRSDKLRGQKLAMTTTNGTQAIDRSKSAKKLIVGSFLNLTSVTRYLRLENENILVVCAGWKGKFSLEDTLFAGALVFKLQTSFTFLTDTVLAALILYQTAGEDLLDFLKKSAHYQRLIKISQDIHKDLAFCLEVDKYTVIPILDKKAGALKSFEP